MDKTRCGATAVAAVASKNHLVSVFFKILFYHFYLKCEHSGIVGRKSTRGRNLQFSDGHGKFPTEFRQTTAIFEYSKYMDSQNFSFCH